MRKGQSVMGSYSGKARVKSLWCRFKLLPSPMIRLACDLVILLFLVRWDTLTNIDFLHKCTFPLEKGNSTLVFRNFPASISQNDQVQITLMPRSIFGGGIFYYPSVWWYRKNKTGQKLMIIEAAWMTHMGSLNYYI